MGIHRFEIVSKNRGVIQTRDGCWWHEDENGVDGYFAMGLGDEEEGVFVYGPFKTEAQARAALDVFNAELEAEMQAILTEGFSPGFKDLTV